MGKRRQVRAKSKLKFGKKKFRGKGESRNEEEEDCERVREGKKRAKSIWRKWFAFFREHWRLRKAKNSNDRKIETDVSKKINVGSNSNESPRDAKAIGFTRKTSNIFIGPSTKASVHRPSTQEKNEASAEPSKEENLGLENLGFERSLRSAPAMELPNVRNCLVCPVSPSPPPSPPSPSPSPRVAASFASGREPDASQYLNEEPRSKFMSTSALFIRENVNPISESGNSVETGLSIEFIPSDNSTEANRQGNEWIVSKNENENGEKALKSVSEPCWNEKRKIFHQQKLQENLNDLIDQFIVLEKDDFMEHYNVNFTKIFQLQNKLKQEKTKFRFESCSSTFHFANAENEKELSEETSREVSPEILVNIKPFKEYMSNRYLNTIQRNSDESRDMKVVPRKKRKESISQEPKHQTCRYDKQNFAFGNEKNIKITDSQTQKEGLDVPNFKEKVSWKLKVENFESSGFEEDFNCKKNLIDASDSVACSIWGLYRTYVDFEDAVLQKIPAKNESLEHVLDDLNDEDHDLVFRQNMSQFRKRITMCSNECSASVVGEETNSSKTEGENGPKAPEEGRVEGFSEGPSPKFEPLTRILLDRVSSQGKSYDNCVFLSFASNVSSKIEAARIETFFISNPLISREIMAILESNFSVLVRNEIAQSETNNLIIIEKTEKPILRNEESQTNCSTANVSDNTEYETACSSLVHLPETTIKIKTEDGEPEPEDLNKLFLRSTDCFYVTDLEQHSPGERFHEVLVRSTDEDSNRSHSQARRHRILFLPPKTFHRDLQIVDGSPHDFILEFVDNEPLPTFLSFNSAKGLSATEFNRKNSSKTKISSSSSETFTGTLRKEVCEFGAKFPDAWLQLVSKRKNNFSEFKEDNEVWTSTPNQADEKVVLEKIMDGKEGERRWSQAAEMKKDGFRILYDGLLRKCLDECEDGRASGQAFGQSIALKYGTASELLRKSGEPPRLSLAETRENGKLHILSQIHFLKRVDKGTPAKLFKYKSISSPGENLTQSEYRSSEYRLRRFLHLAKEMEESESQNAKKRRATLERGIEIRRTGSALMRKSGTFLGSIYVKENAGKKADAAAFSDEWKTLTRTPDETVDPDQRCFNLWSSDLTNDPLFNRNDVKNMTNSKKELMAAINSIREFDRGKEDFGKGTKRMSLVILLSKNK